MWWFNKKDKRNNDYLDHRANQLKTNFLGGLGFLVLYAIIYGLYKLYQLFL